MTQGLMSQGRHAGADTMDAVSDRAVWAQAGGSAAPVAGGVVDAVHSAPPQDWLPLERAGTVDQSDLRPAWLDRGRIPTLDGLRALSIALVFLEHGSDATGYHAPGILRRLVGTIGAVGVDVFFAISGFLITLLLLRELDRTKAISLRGFYVRRFLRLM